MEMTDRIRKLAEQYRENIVRVRRTVHANPELGHEEFQTAAFLVKELSALGYEVQSGLGGTGVSVLLRGAEEGKTLLVRADMDALPIREETGLPFASRTDGKMHACGHDAHVAAVYGAACILKELKEELCGNIRFVFQQGEEVPNGAGSLIASGILEDPPVDAAVSTHVWPDIEAGRYGVRTGPVMAAPDFFTITIHGKGGHGSQPEKCIDPIRVGHRIYEELSEIPATVSGVISPSVVSVTLFQAGTCSNAFPDSCVMEGTVRSYDAAVQEKIRFRMEKVINSAGERYGASCTLQYRTTCPAVVNDAGLAQTAIRSAEKLWGKDAVVETPVPAMTGEDFSCYLEKVPGVFIWTGVRREDLGMTWPLHHPKFTADEDTLHRTSALLSQFAADYLGCEKRLS